MNELSKEFLSVVAAAVQNQSFDTCSRWAVNRRIMEDGQAYSIEDYPYVQGILDSRAQRNWIMKGAQTGLSEAGFTIAFFEIDFHQKDVLYYFPTGKTAETFSKTRFANAIAQSPYLKNVVTTDSVELKQIGTSTIHILGANSIHNLKSRSAGRIVLDELDEWTARQIYLAEERASGQKNNDKIIWGISTPKFPGRGIDKQYKNSTREHYHFDCPHCSKTVKLEWETSFVVHGTRVDDPDVHKSYICCPECKKELPHEDKKDWLRNEQSGGSGRWIATNPDADPKLSRGFHVSQLYSCTVSPGEIAIKFLRGKGDEEARRTFWNDCMGLAFIEEAHQVTDDDIDEIIREYSIHDVKILPKRATDGIFTLGIDQGDPHHWVAVKWGFHANRVGDPNDRAHGRVIGFGQILQDDWPSIHKLMRKYMVRRAVIDYFPDPTDARVFARSFAGAVYLCQYVQGTSGREVRLTEDDYGANLVRVDKVGWLSKSLGRIMSGDIDFPMDVTTEFREQLKEPVRTTEVIKGQPVARYVDSDHDHYAHALNYAEIALKILDPSLHSSSIITNTREN